jgi:hypothetical protein
MLVSDPQSLTTNNYQYFAAKTIASVPYYIHADGKLYNAYYYVSSHDNGGRDTNNGLTVAKAFKNLSTAVEQAKISTIKTIVIVGELYSNSVIDPVNNGSVFYLIDTGIVTIKGIDGNAKLLSQAGSGKRVMRIAGDSNINFENIRITGGNGQSKGGGIYMNNTGVTVTLGPGAEVSGNKTTNNGQGGGIYINKANLFIVSGAIKSNSAYTSYNTNGEPTGDGGGIYMKDGKLNMIGGVIGGRTTQPNSGYVNWSNPSQYADGKADSNKAANAGGLYIMGMNSMTPVEVTLSSGALIQFNRSELDARTQGGGGVYIGSYAKVFLNSGAKISYNFSATDGGGVFAPGGDSAEVTINDGCEISYNYATFGGGAYPQSGASLTMNGGSIKGNYARKGGGGIQSYSGSKFIMNGGSIAGNTAMNPDDPLEGQGGGYYMNGTNNIFRKTGGIIYGNDAGEYSNRAPPGKGSSVAISGSTTYAAPSIYAPNTATFLDTDYTGNYPPTP